MKKISQIFFVFVLITQQTYALSLKDFFANAVFGSTTTKNSSLDNENVQTLSVFEANKNIGTSVGVQTVASRNLNNTDLTLVPGKDNFSNDDEILSASHEDNVIYKVQKGDTIYSIASYFEVSPDTILSFNHKKDKSVTVDEVLEVPSTPGILYEVKKGDTLTSISKKYTIDPSDVALYGGFLLDDQLTVGDEIYLPGAKEKEILIKKVDKNKNIVTTKSSKNILAYKPRNWDYGDTSHLNTVSNINKFMNAVKYSGYYIYPAPGTTRTQKMHGNNGVDLAGPIGTPVLSAASGVVRVAKTGGYNFGYGNYIIVTHPNGTETVYGHLSQVSVVPGESVSAGTVIGAVGSTGNSTGPHLHFEIHGAYNPWAW